MCIIPSWSAAQTCPNLVPAQPCSQLNAGIISCTGSQNFCIGDSVCLSNVSTGTIDSVVICWGDGSPTQSFTGNPTQPFKHRYNYRPDSCVTDGFVEFGFVMYLYQNCPAPTLVGKVPYPVYIKFKPKANFTLANDTICQDEPVSFVIPGTACTNTSANNPPAAVCTWNFGDGTIIVDTSYFINPPVHSYALPGSYTITLTIQNSCGVSSVSRTVYVKPSLLFQAAVATDTCVAFPYTFSPVVHTEHVSAFNWTSNNGGMTFQQPSDSIPIIRVTAAGTYQINLAVSGCCFAPAICNWDTTVVFNQGPTLTALGNLNACNTADIQANSIFSVQDPSSTITAYQWNFTGGTPASSTAANPGLIHYGSPGTYPISLYVTSSCGVDTILDTLRIGVPPQLNVSLSPLTGCDSLHVTVSNTSPAGQSYQWNSIGAVFTSNAQQAAPDIFYGSPGNYSVNVTAATPGCPTLQQNWNVSIGTGPSLTRVGSITGNCDSSFQVVFANYYQLIPQSSDSGYNWTVANTSGTLFSNTSATPPSFTTNAYGTYYVSALAWNGCDSIVLRDTFTLTAPVAVTVGNDTTICHNSSNLILSSSPTGGNWTINGTGIAGNSIVPASYTTVNNWAVYTYGAATCQVKDSLQVTIIGADVNAGPDRILCGNSGIINLTGVPSGGTWSGSGIVNSSSGQFDPALISGSGSTVYYTVNDAASGCVTTDSLQVSVLTATGTILSMPDTTCIQVAESFINPTAGTTATWNFGDGSALVTSNTATHSYQSPGTFYLSIEIVSSNGCKDTLYDTVQVERAPIASFTLSADSGCAVLTEVITNTSSGNASTLYAWNYGNGTTDTILTPPVVFYQQGPGDSTQYTIQLTASNACGSSSYQKTITVYPVPLADFQVDRSEFCSPDTVTFSNVTTGAPQRYAWYIDQQFITSDSLLPMQVFLADSVDRIYHVMLIASNKCGSDTMIRDVLVHPSSIVPFFNIDKPWGCKPLTVTFTSSVLSNSNVWWKLGDGNLAFGDTIVHQYDSTGTFTIWQYVDNFCGFDSVQQQVTVFDKPPVSFTVPPVNCSNLAVPFVNTSLGAIGQVWNFGDGSALDSTHTNPLHQYPGPGIYQASLLVYASGTACVDSTSQFVVIKDIPTAALDISQNAGCPPLEINLNLSNQSLNAVRYIWDMGNGDSLFGTPQSYTYDQSGSYTVKLIAIDNNNCQDDTSFSFVNVYPENTPVASFTALPAEQSILTPTIDFQNNTLYGVGYEWSFGDSQKDYSTSPQHSYAAIGEYVVQLIAENHYGCSDTAIDTVYIYPQLSVYIPNAFTPNGKNPTFKPLFSDIDQDAYLFTVYNRWGQKVFETSDPEAGWNGRYNGKEAEEGVYVYVLKTQAIQVSERQEEVRKRGTVTLLR